MGSMPRDLQDDRRLRRYLLGELPDDERERLQAAYFADDALFARLLGVEDALVDAYVRGELTESERARFEQRFGLTGRQLDRVKVARMLADAGGTPVAAMAARSEAEAGARARSTRTHRLAAPAAAAAVLLALAAAVTWRSGHDGKVVSTPTATTAPAPTSNDADRRVPRVAEGGAAPSLPARPGATPRASSPRSALAHPATGSLASVVLGAGLLRDGGETPRLILSPRTVSARVRLELPPELPPRGRCTSPWCRPQTARKSSARVASASTRDPRGARSTWTCPSGGSAPATTSCCSAVSRADGSPQLVRGYAFRAM
jgi:hypothetical protein